MSTFNSNLEGGMFVRIQHMELWLQLRMKLIISCAFCVNFSCRATTAVSVALKKPPRLIRLTALMSPCPKSSPCRHLSPALSQVTLVFYPLTQIEWESRRLAIWKEVMEAGTSCGLWPVGGHKGACLGLAVDFKSEGVGKSSCAMFCYDFANFLDANKRQKCKQPPWGS